MKLSRIRTLFSYVLRSKIIWHKPKNARVLIVDRAGSELFLTYLDSGSLEIMDLRSESVNIYVLLACLFRGTISKLDYIVIYMGFVQPKIVLTFIHNNFLFYRLKNYRRDVVTIFVQNGVSSESEFLDLSEMRKSSTDDFEVDYMFTSGTATGEKYLQFINGKFEAIGFFKNNIYQSLSRIEPKSVLFLSQYTRPWRSEEETILKNAGGRGVSWREFYSAEAFLLPLLARYCRERSLKLKICARNENCAEEQDFFKNILNGEPFEMAIKDGPYSSYKSVEEAGLVVNIDSTLGYEALARGKRTAAFAIRGNLIGSVERGFGWPTNLPDRGPFWADVAEEREFERVMGYITSVCDEDWESARRSYLSELVGYDPGNTRFCGLMKELGVPMKEGRAPEGY